MKKEKKTMCRRQSWCVCTQYLLALSISLENHVFSPYAKPIRNQNSERLRKHQTYHTITRPRQFSESMTLINGNIKTRFSRKLGARLHRTTYNMTSSRILLWSRRTGLSCVMLLKHYSDESRSDSDHKCSTSWHDRYFTVN